jgi:hypothetical protein
MFATLAIPASALPVPPIGTAAAGEDHDPLPAGCGWFESSRDLSRGLAVVEHLGFDDISDAAPLAWQLAGWL